MFREKIPPRQLSAWLLTGLIPVLIQLLSGASWVWVAVAVAASLVLTLIMWHKGWELRKWQCPFLFIYIVVLLSQLLPLAAQSWPVGNSDPAVPLILLLLAAWSARKGPSAAARVGVTLFWAVLLLYLIVLCAGTKDAQLHWLKPQWNAPDALALTLLLLPAASACLLMGNTGARSARLFLLPLLLTTAAMITAGVLSPDVASDTPNAFYEMTRSIDLFGVASRFEPLISAGMTVGWFALMSILLTLCGVAAHKIFAGLGEGGVWLAAIAAAISRLCGLHIPGWIMLLSGTVFWVAMPLLTQGLDLRKKS